MRIFAACIFIYMKNKLNVALFNADTLGGGTPPPCVGIKSCVLPEVQEPLLAKNSDTGVSTSSARTAKHWYAMRTTYGREQKAYDYIVSNGGTAFLPLVKKERKVNGEKKMVDVSRIPNIFFVYGTEDEIKTYAFDNVHLPFLRFYYESHHEGVKIIKEPLIVPDRQMRSLQILCQAEAEDIRFVPDEMVTKFQAGDSVLITEGEFKGIEGKVARWHGQQRVAIIIEGLCVIATAYVPSAYLEKQR